MIICLDLLGMGSPAWKIEKTIKIFPVGAGYGCFLNRKLFGGDPMPKVKKLHASGKPSMFRGQLDYNSKHALPSEKFIRAEVPRWDELAALNPKMPHFISPSCEYVEESSNKVHDIMSLTAELAPHCGIVQTPGRLKNGKLSPTFADWYIEEHGNRARTGADFISTDGENAYDMCDEMDASKGVEDWIERHRATARYCFLWGARFNLIEAHNTLPPAKRTAAPEPAYTQGVFHLGDPRPIEPVPTFPFVAPKKPYLYKTFAEDQQGSGDKRENRPMFMVPKRAKPLPFVDLVDYTGKRIARFNLFKDTNPKRETDRYYWTKTYAWQLGVKAIAMSGYPFAWLSEKGKMTGPFFLPQRAPFFQVPK